VVPRILPSGIVELWSNTIVVETMTYKDYSEINAWLLSFGCFRIINDE